MRYKPITVENIDKVINYHFVSKNALVRKPPSELPPSCRSRVSRTKKWNLIIFSVLTTVRYQKEYTFPISIYVKNKRKPNPISPKIISRPS